MSDAQREAALAMLQLLFLVVHSLAQHHEAQEALAEQDSSALPTLTRRHTSCSHPGAAPATAFQLAKDEVNNNLMDLDTCLSEFTSAAIHLLSDLAS